MRAFHRHATLGVLGLDKFIVLGKRHLAGKFIDDGNTTRSCMVRDHLPAVRDGPNEVESLKPNQVGVRSHVGGLVKSLPRKAA